MRKSVVISVDAMGGDHGPSVVIPACAKALREHGDDFRLLLHGDETQLRAEMTRANLPQGVAELRHAERAIAMDEKPAQALRRAKGTSMWNALDAIRQGDADVAVSAGNTGALVVISRLVLRMSADVDRPALVTSIPNPRGFTTFLDAGATVQCDAERLVEFAVMGEAFHRAAHAVARPTVGLLNVGSEGAGHEDVQRAHHILGSGHIDLDYRGFVKGDDIVGGKVDVVVTDGFTGNVALKAMEGAVRFVGLTLRDVLRGGLIPSVGALLARPSLSRFGQKMRRPPAAQLLGLNGLVVKCHGGASVPEFASGVCAAADIAMTGFITEVERNLTGLQQAS